MTDTVLHLTDFHVFADPFAKLKGIPTRESLLRVLEHVRESELDFQRVVVTGDHTHDEQEATYRDLYSILEHWLPILNTVPGNHDDRELIRKVFSGIVPAAGPLTFATELGNWLLLGLDSHVPGEVHGEIPAAQLDWAAGRCDAFDGPVGMFFHHPPVQVGSAWMDKISLQNQAEVSECFAGLPNLQFISCGHVHCEFQLQMGHVSVLTTPSTGLQFDPDGLEPSFASRPPGYRVFEFDGDRFSTRVVEVPGLNFVPEVG